MGSAPSKKRVNQASQFSGSSTTTLPSTPVVIYPTRPRVLTPPSPVRLTRIRARTPPSSLRPARPRVLTPPRTVFPIRTVVSPPSAYVQHHQSVGKNPSSNDQLTPYGTIWEKDGKLSSSFEGGLVTRVDGKLLEHFQEENRRFDLTSEQSSTFGTVEMHSVLTSEVETKHSLTTSDQLDGFIQDLKKTNSTFDESVQQRIKQISQQTEAVLGRILHEAEINQQQLLQRAKEEQTKEDELYRHELEEFLCRLDLQRAKKLDRIQSELVAQRHSIFEESQLKLRSLVSQANSLKTQIMSQEENQATIKIDSIIEQMTHLNEHPTLQQLGTQTKTQIHFTRQETIGTTIKTNNNNK